MDEDRNEKKKVHVLGKTTSKLGLAKRMWTYKKKFGFLTIACIPSRTGFSNLHLMQEPFSVVLSPPVSTNITFERGIQDASRK